MCAYGWHRVTSASWLSLFGNGSGIERLVRRVSLLSPNHIPFCIMSTRNHDQRDRSPSPATITKVSSPHALPSIPTPGLVLSVAEGAHYSSLPRHSASEMRRASFGPGVSEDSLPPPRKQVLKDVKDVCIHVLSRRNIH